MLDELISDQLLLDQLIYVHDLQRSIDWLFEGLDYYMWHLVNYLMDGL